MNAKSLHKKASQYKDVIALATLMGAILVNSSDENFVLMHQIVLSFVIGMYN